jgi:hypothetical protein
LMALVPSVIFYPIPVLLRLPQNPLQFSVKFRSRVSYQNVLIFDLKQCRAFYCFHNFIV